MLPLKSHIKDIVAEPSIVNFKCYVGHIFTQQISTVVPKMNARGAVVPTCMFPCQELSNMAVSAHLLPTPPLMKRVPIGRPATIGRNCPVRTNGKRGWND